MIRVSKHPGLTALILSVAGLSPVLSAQQAPTSPPTFEASVEVLAATPLPGVEMPADQIAAPVQSATSKDLDSSGALDISDFLKRRATAVHVNEIQGNPFQADVSYRGYTASPLLGTPQGLSVYLDGVRMNQPFGEVVSWDLIPRVAVGSSTLMPGSNPLFGLNTLGGALVLHTKDGQANRGTTVQGLFGSNLRRAIEVEHGGARASGALNWYVAGNLFAEDGWRDDSPSDVRQLFGKLGWQAGRTGLTLTAAHADNSLHGNGLQELRLLERDYRSVYTTPDITDNRSTLVNLTLRRTQSERLTFSGNAYYRDIHSNSLNGDINEGSLDQAVYQPGAAERAALLTAGYANVPASGATAANTPFPFWRCLGNVLLNDEPGEKCNGLLNTTEARQHNAGLSGQAMWRLSQGALKHQLTLGGALDASNLGFAQQTELGYLAEDRSVTGTGAFADGETGGDVDGEPFDTRVDLDGRQRTWSVFAADTLSVGRAWHLTASGRYNRTRLENTDNIRPDGDASLSGDHIFARLNPAVGLTFNPSSALNLYAGYSEGSRAATSVELGCANPEQPCKLPNAMAGDPPLKQVVTRTVEAGVRSTRRRAFQWNAGVYLAQNNDDIMFVAATDTGFGYFKNFGTTRRQGVELGVSGQAGPFTIGAGYNFLDATFQSAELLNGSGNSSNEENQEEGTPGVESSISVVAGHRIPLIPRHSLKLFGEWQATGALSVDLDLQSLSRSPARGNENGGHEPDGVYYMGPGESAAYTVVSLGVRYRAGARLDVFARVNNALDRTYYTAAQLGPTGITPDGAFVARPFPAINGEFPVQQSTFFAPGAPRTAVVGTRVRF
ncbi:MAG: TonB-dependent receptor [Vicinamibacterales bacterium]